MAHTAHGWVIVEVEGGGDDDDDDDDDMSALIFKFGRSGEKAEKVVVFRVGICL